jgi:hypothetical protein
MPENAASGPGFFTVRDRDIVLRVRAKPNARADRAAGVRGDSLLVEVRAAPERGRANEAVARVLAEALGLRASGIVLKAGATAPRKLFILPREAGPALERLAKEFS